jgi:hypothetical protein
METKTASQANEMFTETSKIAGKWLADSSASMMEIFNKQMNLATSFYSNLFRNFWGAANDNSSAQGGVSVPFWGANEMMKAFSTPFNGHAGNGNSANSVFANYSKYFTQMAEFNRSLFSQAIREIPDATADWKPLAAEYERLLESELQNTKELVDTMMENYKKRMEFTTAANQKFVDELARQFNAAVRQNLKFWENAMKLSVNQGVENKKSQEESGANTKKSAESVMNDTKAKPTLVK